MNKKNSKYIIGLTLIEILIGIAITTIMMAAMYTSYSVVNQSYSKVSEKAKISKSSRDLVSMLMRDIRMAGFTYYVGTYEITKFAEDTEAAGCTPGITLPKTSYLEFDNGFDEPERSHNPVVIRKNLRRTKDGTSTFLGNSGQCCDQIEIVYEDFDQNDLAQPFQKYKITYFGQETASEPIKLPDGTDDTITRYGVYKKIENWVQPIVSCDIPEESTVAWDTKCAQCTPEPVLIRDHIEDMEFIPFDENGRIIKDSVGKFPAPEENGTDDKGRIIRDRLYDIRGVDIRITFRSKEDFFRAANTRIISGLSGTDATNTDKFLRDSVIVSVHTRNIGGESF